MQNLRKKIIFILKYVIHNIFNLSFNGYIYILSSPIVFCLVRDAPFCYHFETILYTNTIYVIKIYVCPGFSLAEHIIYIYICICILA